jgi:hypothetical protein
MMSFESGPRKNGQKKRSQKVIKMSDYVWYACYGSNLLKSSFLCYVRGGTPEGSERLFQGCSDKSDPRDCRQIVLPFEIYFSRKSKSWENKGVAFIKSQKNADAKTLGRMYLITKEQFVQVVRQENRKPPADSTINIDFEKAISEGGFLIPGIAWYGRILSLGSEGDNPILTFTDIWRDEDIVPSAPGKKYLRVLIRGIKEAYDLPDEDIVEYLKRVEGIRNRICEQEIIEIVRSALL